MCECDFLYIAISTWARRLARGCLRFALLLSAGPCLRHKSVQHIRSSDSVCVRCILQHVVLPFSICPLNLLRSYIRIAINDQLLATLGICNERCDNVAKQFFLSIGHGLNSNQRKLLSEPIKLAGRNVFTDREWNGRVTLSETITHP